MEREGFEPPNPKERIYSPPRLASSLSLLRYKWRETESNRRHMELQSIALPTELPSLLREQDLNLRPSGYEPDELPSCSIPRYLLKEDVGFEPTHAFTRLTVFKTVPFSRTWVILHITKNSPYGIRTRVTAVKRRCLNPLTNGPYS
ncbi:hypothetical protein SAJ_0157 [Streptococcus agalactiae 18RS21]|nr:hypothetical protein SAJ_0157 [Streptococcus agalactiae 18RS21]